MTAESDPFEREASVSEVSVKGTVDQVESELQATETVLLVVGALVSWLLTGVWWRISKAKEARVKQIEERLLEMVASGDR